MTSELTTYISLVCISGVLNAYLSLYVFFNRHNYKNISYFFILYTFAITVYVFGSAFGLLATSLEQVKFWSVIQYMGLPFAPPLGLLFIMRYLGMKIKKISYPLLLIIPFISLVMVATNDLHHLHYRVMEADPVRGIPFLHLEIGIWYVIHGVFIFTCMFAALLLLLTHWKETAKEYRLQIIALMLGQLIPIFTAFFYLNGLTPPGIDPVPMVLWLISLLYLWSINTSRMFRIMPIAKDAIFNSIDDGVMVLDESMRLIEFNQSCQNMFSALNKTLYGMDFSNVWFVLSRDTFPTTLDAAPFTLEVQFVTDDSKRIYQVRVSALNDGNRSRGWLIIFTDITELKKLQNQLERQAYYDELTQILNRRAFIQKCEQAFAAARKTSSPFTIILFDVDHFKRINDTYGHYIGDQLLVHITNVCQTQINEDILFARYGGEEFVLALKNGSTTEGEALATRLCRSIETQPLSTNEGMISATISCGVAEATWKTGENLDHLLQYADQALYAAKRDGRNRVHIYTVG